MPIFKHQKKHYPIFALLITNLMVNTVLAKTEKPKKTDVKVNANTNSVIIPTTKEKLEKLDKTALSTITELSLDQAWQLSQQFDPFYLATKKEFEANLEKEVQARSQLLPQLGFAATSTQQNQQNTFGGGFSDRDSNISSRNLQYGLEFRQPLWNTHLWKQFQQGKLGSQIATLNYRLAKQDAILRVANNYIALLQLQNEKESLMSQKRSIEKQLAFARKSFEVGTKTITDTLEAQSRYDQIISQELGLEQTITVKKRTLYDLLGSWTDIDHRPQLGQYSFQLKNVFDTQYVDEPLDDLNHWLELAKKFNPQIQLSHLNVTNAQLQIEKERANHYPTVDLVANASKSRSPVAFLGGANLDNVNRSISLQVEIPIFNGGSIVSKVKEAEALLGKVKLEQENVYKNVIHQLEELVFTINSNIAKYNAYKTALKSTQASLKATKTAFELGLRTQLDVLNSQTQVSDIETKLNNTQSETYLLWLKLQANAGVLDEDSFK